MYRRKAKENCELGGHELHLDHCRINRNQNISSELRNACLYWLTRTGPSSVSDGFEFCLLLHDWAKIVELLYHLLLPGDKWPLYYYWQVQFAASPLFHLTHDLFCDNFHRSNIVAVLIFCWYQLISCCDGKHAAFVWTLSCASPVLSSFCRLLCEILSVIDEHSFISLRYSPRKLTHSIYVGCLGTKR